MVFSTEKYSFSKRPSSERRISIISWIKLCALRAFRKRRSRRGIWRSVRGPYRSDLWRKLSAVVATMDRGPVRSWMRRSNKRSLPFALSSIGFPSLGILLLTLSPFKKNSFQLEKDRQKVLPPELKQSSRL